MSMKEHINYAITKLSFSFSSSRVTPYGGLLINVINLIKNCVYNQQNILKNFLFLKKFCFFL